MASDGSVTAIGLLLFTAFTQGHFGMLDRSYSINTTAGQRVTLPCLQEKEHNLNILQIEWKKMEGRAEVKIAICNPAYGPPNLYWTNVSVSVETSGSKLKGSVLELSEVSVWDSGIYVCELTTFPHGTVKAKTSLTVTGHFGMLDRSYSINTTVGQRVTLPCLQEKEHNLNILQIEWKKMEGRAEVKIAICNPAYGPPNLYWTNVSVSVETSGSKLKGSVLELSEVSVWDSGIYVCELTTFPHGTVKAKTSLTVTGFSVFLSGHFGMLDRSYSINTTAGQRVTLPCLQDKEHNLNILQIEWKKMEGRAEVKIAICNPAYGPPNLYWTNVSVSVETSGSKLKGSVLELSEVSVWDSGIYVCELTTFPHGTVKAKTSLTVTDAPVSARVVWPNRVVREGDDVTILCTSTPPASSYFLWPSQNKSSILKSEDGRFTLPNVTRDDSNLYICQPSDLSFHHYSATVNVTVNYLDEIECDTLRSVEVTAGQNVTVTCAANASQNSQYTWRKGDVTVSTSGSLHLWPVSREQAGVYVLTVVVNATGLQRQTEFNITVRRDSGDLTPSTAPPTSTATSGNSHGVTRWSTAVSTATEESLASSVPSPSSPARTASSSAPQRDATTGAARLFSTGHAGPLNATLPPFENNGTENASSPGQPTATARYGTSVTATTRLSNSSRNVTSDLGVSQTGPRGSGRYVVFIVVPILLLLLVILFLYGRNVVQRRTDMPPPFKPPPPPVKYTSIKTQDACVTIQQPCDNRNVGYRK
ncbi:hemicentin-2 isoform X3 [Anguilla anguilla]|uniref:hemicentin-2 isoform X3 n=1 Tax=Anguilla anguilla TaxID=7936 RepID=UPI0015AE862A|nr:hemicentin-2 isoform X3 [Anguilla anguilla]